jgi:hypothetical protein
LVCFYFYSESVKQPIEYTLSFGFKNYLKDEYFENRKVRNSIAKNPIRDR